MINIEYFYEPTYYKFIVKEKDQMVIDVTPGLEKIITKPTKGDKFNVYDGLVIAYVKRKYGLKHKDIYQLVADIEADKVHQKMDHYLALCEIIFRMDTHLSRKDIRLALERQLDRKNPVLYIPAHEYD